MSDKETERAARRVAAGAARRELILRGPVTRALLTLAWPAALSGQLALLLWVLETFWMGRIAGTVGLAVSTAIGPFDQLMSALVMSISIGGASLLARALGARSKDGARIVASTLVFALATSAGLAALGILFSRPIAAQLAGQIGVVDQTRRYLVVLMLGLPVLAVAMVVNGVFNASGWPQFTLLRLLFDLILIATLTPVLTRTFGLGVTGPPAMVAISFLVLDLVMLQTLVRRREQLGIVHPIHGPVLDGALWRRIVAIGGPVQLGRISIFLYTGFLIERVMRDGRVATAAFGVAFRLVMIATLFSFSLARSNGTMLGQNLGAKNPARMFASLRTSALLLALVCPLLIAIAPFCRPAVRLFSTDPVVIEETMRALAIMRWAVPAVAIWQLLSEAYTATGVVTLAGALMVLSDVVALTLLLLWPSGSALERASFGFCLQHVLKALALAPLLGRGLLRPAQRAAAAA